MNRTVAQVPAVMWGQLCPCPMHPVHGKSGVGAARCPTPLPTRCCGMLCPQSADTPIHLDEGDLGT